MSTFVVEKREHLIKKNSKSEASLKMPARLYDTTKDHEDLRSNMIVLDTIKLFATGCNLMLKIAVLSLKKTKCILWFLDILSTV